MVFDLAESVTVAARHIVAQLLARQLTFSFDIDEHDFLVDGDLQATSKGLHRLLSGALDVLTSGMLVISASTAGGKPTVHIAGVGTTADDNAVNQLLKSLALNEQAAGTKARIATGVCPVMGAAIHFVCDRDEGFTLDAHLPYALVGGSPLPPSAQGEILWLMAVRAPGAEIVRRRFKRLGWNVVVFQVDEAAEAGAALMNQAPALAVILEPHVTVTAAVYPWLDLPFPSSTQRILGVPLGSHCLSKTPDPAWVVHPVPFSPRDLALLTAAHQPGFDVDTLSPPLAEELTAIPRLLIVDDNPTNRILASAVANVLGYDAALAENGMQGVQACREFAPAAVLMDVNMPIMDGIEATQRIRSAQRRGEIEPFAIIGATANISPEILRACYHAGMDVVLHKPLDVQELAAHLRRLCLKAPRSKTVFLY